MRDARRRPVADRDARQPWREPSAETPRSFTSWSFILMEDEVTFRSRLTTTRLGPNTVHCSRRVPYTVGLRSPLGWAVGIRSAGSGVYTSGRENNSARAPTSPHRGEHTRCVC